MKILYIQHTGDFAEAYDRLIAKGGKENYYGQKYSVNAVVQQARSGIEVMILVLITSEHKRIDLEKNLTSISLDDETFSYKLIQDEILAFSPDAVILRTPDHKILNFLRKHSIDTFPVFADSFEKIPPWSVRRQFRKLLLARELKDKSIKWVANHQINASRSIQNLGVSADKILPYDWEHEDNPSNWHKDIPSDLCEKEIAIFYAGQIYHDKGIFDLIYALKYIRDSGRKFSLKIAGKGQTELIEKLSHDLQLSENIQVLGLIDHEDVLKNMNQADVVVVPSHHCYPEGLPMTIMEGLMVHTPVIASDHPMFVGRVGLRGSVVFFREKNSKDLSEKILSICSDLDQYRQMSSNASLEWLDLNLELKWEKMINNWICDSDFDFSQYTLRHFN